RVDDHASGHVGSAVQIVARAVRIVEVVGKRGLVPLYLAVDRLGIGIEKELRGIAALPLRRHPGPMDAKAVALAGHDVGQIAVPAEAGDLGKLDPGLLLLGVEEAEFDAYGDHREDGKV